MLFRTFLGLRYAKRPVRHFLVWLVASNEYTNYTYDLEDRNKRYLAAFVAQVTDTSYDEALGYIREAENDTDLKRHVQEQGQHHRSTDSDMPYGRRLGWYAVVRLLKPRVVVETGIDKGLGTCVLTAALKRNQDEGHPGYYYGTDINPEAGQLFRGAYAEYGRILYGDSVTSLEKLDGNIDVFINDSDHSAAYEAQEYHTVETKLSSTAVILGDNAHITDELLKFARRTDRQFLFFREEPRNHWYGGAGIGAAFRKT